MILAHFKPLLKIAQDLASGIIDPFEHYMSTADYAAFGVEDGSEARRKSETEASNASPQAIDFSDPFFQLL